MSSGASASSPCKPAAAHAIPSAPPMSPRVSPSPNTWRASRPGWAPSAIRIAQSRRRSTTRLTQSPPRLTLMISNTAPTAPSSSHNSCREPCVA